MAYIRTVLGDISPGDFGICDSHEHLIRSGGPELREGKDFLLDSLEAAEEEVASWIEAGGRSLVCMEAIGAGRNVPKMLQLAESFRGKAHILMTTGFLKGGIYDPRVDFLATVTADQLADMMALEITQGMDLHSYNGPVVVRTGAKAGLVKAGTSYGVITAMDAKTLEVAALTQQRTGCPISVHTQMGTMGLEVCQLLREYGADLSRTILCHLQKDPDPYYHRRVLEQGVYLCYDGPDRAKYFPDSVHARNLKWLVEQGYEDRLLLSMDAGRASYQRGYMMREQAQAEGIRYLLTRFVPLLLEMGIPRRAVEKMLTANPAKAFSFDGPEPR